MADILVVLNDVVFQAVCCLSRDCSICVPWRLPAPGLFRGHTQEDKTAILFCVFHAVGNSTSFPKSVPLVNKSQNPTRIPLTAFQNKIWASKNRSKIRSAPSFAALILSVRAVANERGERKPRWTAAQSWILQRFSCKRGLLAIHKQNCKETLNFLLPFAGIVPAARWTTAQRTSRLSSLRREASDISLERMQCSGRLRVRWLHDRVCEAFLSS